METFDVVVVGGGPAGLSAAETAAGQGAEVLVLERAREIGLPVRTSGGAFIPQMRALGIPESLWQPIRTVEFLAPTKVASYDYTPAYGCVLDVTGLYRWLAERACAAGAQVRTGVGVTGLVEDDGRVVGVRTRDGRTVRARVVVDATGAWARLGTAVGATGRGREAAGLEVVVQIPDSLAHTAAFTVDRQATYGWLFPERSGLARLGVGVIRPDSTSPLLAELEHVAHAIAARYDLPPFVLDGTERHAGVYPIRRPGRVDLLPRPGLVLVGDAGPGGSNLLGEGIRYAIASGRIAGQAVGAVATGARPPGHLRSYPRRWARRYGPSLRLADAANPRISSLSPAQWDDAVELAGTWSAATMGRALATQLGPGLVGMAVRDNPRTLLALARLAMRRATAAD